MHSDRDQPFIEWAKRRGCAYYYASDSFSPLPRLQLYLSALTVSFRAGKLVRIEARSDGQLIDQMMCELMELFALCAQHDAYLAQGRCIRQH